jgi:hypothetical protein
VHVSYARPVIINYPLKQFLNSVTWNGLWKFEESSLPIINKTPEFWNAHFTKNQEKLQNIESEELKKDILFSCLVLDYFLTAFHINIGDYNSYFKKVTHTMKSLDENLDWKELTRFNHNI